MHERERIERRSRIDEKLHLASRPVSPIAMSLNAEVTIDNRRVADEREILPKLIEEMSERLNSSAYLHMERTCAHCQAAHAADPFDEGRLAEACDLQIVSLPL